MEGRKTKASKFKEETGVWDLKKLQPVSKVGKISQSCWIKFLWLPTHRAHFQGEEPTAIPHFSSTTPAQHTKPHTSFLNKHKHKWYQGLQTKAQLHPELINSAAAAAAAKSFQSCPTLCNPIDCSLPGSPVPGILQARTLEWVALSFSNAWKWKVKVKSLSHVQLLVTPWTAACQIPPSMGFSRQKYWSGVPSPWLTLGSTKLAKSFNFW